jgi:hypothetical protein
MDAEAARVQIEEIDRLKKGKRLTLLFDGWEDKLRRSLYGTVTAQVGEYPTVLSLDDLTGHRGSANKYLETAKKAMKNMEIEDGRNIIALTTDNPTVMQSFRGKFKSDYHWVLVRNMSQSTIQMEYLIRICRYLRVFCMDLIPSSEKFLPTRL